MLLLVFLLPMCQGSDVADPPLIVYPGQVNIGLLSSIHSPSNGSAACGSVRPQAVQRAMAAVWATAQHRDNTLNIGVYVFDTCGRADVAERQVFRLLSHVGPTDCRSTTPPLFAVMTEGEESHLHVPLRMLRAFSVPVIALDGNTATHDVLTTAHGSRTLAQAAVTVLSQLRLLEVAVMAEDDSESGLFGAFARQARVSGMRPVLRPQSTEDVMDTLRVVANDAKAVVFLVSGEEAVQLLAEAPSSIPWVVVATEDPAPRLREELTPQQLARLQKVLLLSPESVRHPEFESYFQDMLRQDSHSLLAEFADAYNGSYPFADVSSTLRAVWSLSDAVRSVQRRTCTPNTDCLLHMQRNLSRNVGRALADERMKFGPDGQMSTLRYMLRGFAHDGQILQIGVYSEESGLVVDRDVTMPFSEFVFVEPLSEDSTERPSTTTPLSPEDTKSDVVSLHNVSSVGPTYDARPPVSLVAPLMETTLLHAGEEEEEVRLVRLSGWLGRPWCLGVLGAGGAVLLATLYTLVFLMVKGCEGGATLKKVNGALAGVQLLSLFLLIVSAGVFTWMPSPLVCALQRSLPNVALAATYGCLLLRGMFVRAQRSLGLGGSVDRCNQLLTLLFCVGVQACLEAQWWLLHSPSCHTPPPTLHSQAYVAALLLAATAMAAATRKLPLRGESSSSLLCVCCVCVLLLASWCVSCWLLPSARHMAAPAALLATALTVLGGVFGPTLIDIHRYGGVPHKALSYADSLSTVFTMFKDLDQSSTTSRGKKTAKTLHHEMTENPLYTDYHSAYP